jgi:hypothetical protein
LTSLRHRVAEGNARSPARPVVEGVSKRSSLRGLDEYLFDRLPGILAGFDQERI